MAQKFLTEITLQALNNATTDTDKFLVSDGGTIKFRTGAEVLSDIGGQASLTNPVTGTGTTNYVPKFTGSTTIGNSQIFDNGTNVLIGTSTDDNYAKLKVSGGSIIINNNQQFNSYKANGLPLAIFKVDTADKLVFNPLWGQGLSGYSFTISGSEKMSISTGGSVTASGDFRAPIFYDSDNTGYYVDPSSQSNLNTVYANSFVKYGGTSVQYLMADGSVSTGPSLAGYVPTSRTLTINGTSYDLSADRSWTVSAGAADFNTLTNKTGGTGTYQTSGDFRAPIFYDSNDTAYYLDPANTTTALNIASKVAINVGASSGSVILQATSSYGTNSINTYYNVMHTSGDFYIGNPAGTGNNLSGNNAYFSIFYDRNNSAYYIDPASTSNIVGLTVTNTISGNISGNAGTVSTITNRTGLMVNSLAAPALIDGLTTINFRSTLFGTTSNGYQISTARWNTTPSVLSGLSPYSTMIAWAGSDTQGFLAMDYSSPAARMGGGNGNNINWTRRVLLEDAWTNSKYFGSGGEIYGTILYDANDTTYFFDGSSFGDSIRCAGDIVAYYSDERLKDRKGNIENALDKVLSLNGFYYEPNEAAQALGYKKKLEVGVSAQEVQAILPEIVKDAAIGGDYKTLDYGRLTPLLIEAIKEQQTQIDELKELVNKLINK